jgi:Protein of unknown function (DUF3040)
MTGMLTSGEQQELRQIELELAGADRGLARRLAVLQGMLRWARPGRQAYLLVLAVVAAALLWVVAAGGRLLLAFAEGGMLLGPALLTPDDIPRPGHAPGYHAGPARVARRARGDRRGRHETAG